MTKWAPIAGYPEYEISDTATVRRVVSVGHGAGVGKVIKASVSNSGYMQLHLGKKNQRRGHFLHRLVCRAFHGEPPTDKHWVAHNDGDRLNNCAENLRWATPAENQADKKAHGTCYRGSPAERLMKKVSMEISGCWVFNGYKNASGYGVVSKPGSGNGFLKAHRLAFMEFVGQIPDGMLVEQSCRNKSCVNPSHLRLVRRSWDRARRPIACNEAT